MAVTQEEQRLHVADKVGYLYVFDIGAYALRPDQKDEAPKPVNYWRAHIGTVTGLQVIKQEQVLLTSSVDCTVRLWSIHGEFIGTFGQAESWSIHTPSSWKHPAVPYEILVDPLSMPSNCTEEGESRDSEAVATDTREDSKEADDTNLRPDSQSKPRSPLLNATDRDTAEQLNELCYPAEPGKRLRHEIFRHRNTLPNHSGPKDYHTLKCFEIAETPTVWTKPEFSLGGIDHFASMFAEDHASESQ